MGGITIRIVSIEPPWFEEKAQVQSCTWRELNQGHIPQEIVDAITPEFALKLTRSHAKDPNQVVLVALENNHVIGFAELLQTVRGCGTGFAICVGILPSSWCWPCFG